MQIRHVLKEARKIRTPEIDPVTKKVYAQLLPDFPAPALEWVKRADWIGPLEITLEDIDFSDRANWKASHEPEKVKMHMKFIKDGNSKPIVLVQLPEHNLLTVVDAHHRLLAYEALGKKPIAFIGVVRGSDIESALTMHSKQYHGGSKLDGT